VDKDNRSRREVRRLRWVAASAETLCFPHVRSVLEVTRETTHLGGKKKGETSVERVLYLSSLELDDSRAKDMLRRVRQYWEIEAGLHQRLDVSAREDASSVRNRNALMNLGILRRFSVGVYYRWRRKRKNKRQSTLMDFYDDMNTFNSRLAFATISAP
jgi:predicted transposase YbfD/YdcC